VQSTRTVLSMAMNATVRQGLLKANPASALVALKVKEGAERAEGATEGTGFRPGADSALP
jgi:hypothetical protein